MIGKIVKMSHLMRGMAVGLGLAKRILGNTKETVVMPELIQACTKVWNQSLLLLHLIVLTNTRLRIILPDMTVLGHKQVNGSSVGIPETQSGS